jgi:DNA-directed RNA polymerase specialized sigma24 family protein
VLGEEVPRLISTEPADSPSPDFAAELTSIWQDPEIWRLALRRAGDRYLAEDALQETYYAVARVSDPGRIENLRGYFCKVLVHKIYNLRSQFGPIPVEDPETLTGAGEGALSQATARPVDEQAVWLQLTGEWLKPFHSERARLAAMVPERSGNPERYQAVIVATAEKILQAACDGHVVPADANTALRAVYPEWFDESGCAQDTQYQRLSRARSDARALLVSLVRRDELSQG